MRGVRPGMSTIVKPSVKVAMIRAATSQCKTMAVVV